MFEFCWYLGIFGYLFGILRLVFKSLILVYTYQGWDIFQPILIVFSEQKSIQNLNIILKSDGLLCRNKGIEQEKGLNFGRPYPLLVFLKIPQEQMLLL